MSIEKFVLVQVTKAGVPITQQGFGTPAFVNNNSVQDANNRYKEYTSVEEILDDGFLDSSSFYKWATAVFSQNPAPVLVGSVWKAALEDFDDALSAVPENKQKRFYYVCIESRLDADILLVAAWCATRFKIFIPQSDSADWKNGVGGNIGEQLRLLGYKHVNLRWHSSDAEYQDGAMAGKAAAFDLDAPKGAGSWHGKELIGITPNDLSTTELNNILAENGDTYIEEGGHGVTLEGKSSSGEFIDVQTTIHWTYFRVQEAFFETIISAPTKVGMTQEGISQFETKLRAIMNRGIRNGHFSPDFPVIYEIPKITDIAPIDRQNRILNPPAKAYPTLAGAIHTAKAEIIIGV